MTNATANAPAAAAIGTVGVPKEIKTAEHRVAMTPDGVREFERLGISVFVETGAGEGASFTDDHYRAAGAEIVPTAAVEFFCAVLQVSQRILNIGRSLFVIQ